MRQTLLSTFEAFDHRMIALSARVDTKASRIAIFLVFFWFGALKVLGASPASELVTTLLERTMPFIPPDQFVVFLGVVEMMIGLLFLFPKLTRVAILFLVAQMSTTFLPLVLLPHLTWTGPFVPTMEGQYIIKNVIILALALAIGSKLQPVRFSRKRG